MSFNEKEFGAKVMSSIEITPDSSPARPQLTLQPSTNFSHTSSNCLTPTTPKEEYDPTSSHPFSAFYSHPTTRTSFEQLKSTSTVAIRKYDTDLEAQSRTRFSSEPPFSKECNVWPGKHQLVEKSMAMKRSRVCHPLRKLSKRQRLWVKILIAILVIGTAVGVGVGVSKAVGAGVWKSSTQQTQIGDPST